MEHYKVTSKGQIVIPSKLRKKLGIKTGTIINFTEDNGGIKMVPFTKELVRKNFGVLKTGGKLLKALKEEKRTEREL